MVATRPLEAVMTLVYTYRTYMWAKGGWRKATSLARSNRTVPVW